MDGGRIKNEWLKALEAIYIPISDSFVTIHFIAQGMVEVYFHNAVCGNLLKLEHWSVTQIIGDSGRVFVRR